MGRCVGKEGEKLGDCDPTFKSHCIGSEGITSRTFRASRSHCTGSRGTTSTVSNASRSHCTGN